MRIFQCGNCGNDLHFNNDTCLNCNHRVGYVAENFDMATLEPQGDQWQALNGSGKSYYFCQNAEEAACNWLVEVESGEPFCLACRYNLTIPDLAIAENRERWRKIEQAKKHLFYSLTRLGLPIPLREPDSDSGLGFEFLADVNLPNGKTEPVLTGHANGLISINIAEADDAERERRRSMMGEPYRTLIGHFRHEIGHFYWDLLVRDRGRIDDFRAVFGDPDIDYQDALRRHYENGAPSNWQESFISTYATSHPWEDFAETWAHCMHMIDGLETAGSLGVALKRQGQKAEPALFGDPYQIVSTDEIIKAWVPLTVAINSINRSLGQPDLYPFVLTPEIVAKIDFILRLISDSRQWSNLK